MPTSFLGQIGWAIRFVFARLRFLLILGVIGLAITKWDAMVASYQKWVRTPELIAQARDESRSWRNARNRSS